MKILPKKINEANLKKYRILIGKNSSEYCQQMNHLKESIVMQL